MVLFGAFIDLFVTEIKNVIFFVISRLDYIHISIVKQLGFKSMKQICYIRFRVEILLTRDSIFSFWFVYNPWGPK